MSKLDSGYENISKGGQTFVMFAVSKLCPKYKKLFRI